MAAGEEAVAPAQRLPVCWTNEDGEVECLPNSTNTDMGLDIAAYLSGLGATDPRMELLKGVITLLTQITPTDELLRLRVPDILTSVNILMREQICPVFINLPYHKDALRRTLASKLVADGKWTEAEQVWQMYSGASDPCRPPRSSPGKA